MVLPPFGLPSLEGRVEFCGKSGNQIAIFGWLDKDYGCRTTLMLAHVRQAWILGSVSLNVLVGSVFLWSGSWSCVLMRF
jgi:hypothetical protein